MLKTENNQIVREYKTKDNSLNIMEAVMYKIDKDGNTVKIAVYDKFEEKWIKE